MTDTEPTSASANSSSGIEPSTAMDFDVRSLQRPHSNLLAYYAASSLVLGPFFFVILIPLFFRYKTLRYDFDDEGVSMRWGVLFRREISLNYSRIQDIHLKSNVLQRWLGLGDVKLQTASGSAQAEMTIEGFQEFSAIRDYLYSRMRGSQTGVPTKTSERSTPPPTSRRMTAGADGDAVAAELRAARAEMARLADALEVLAGRRSSGAVNSVDSKES